MNKFAHMKQERRSDECKFGVCLPCCTWSSLHHEGLFTKCQKSNFCSKIHNFDLILKKNISKIFGMGIYASMYKISKQSENLKILT